MRSRILGQTGISVSELGLGTWGLSGDGYGGVACAYLFDVADLLAHTTTLKRTSLAGAVSTLGTVDTSFPYGQVDESKPGGGAPYGRTSWRKDLYDAGCSCWKVTSPAWNASLL